MQKKCIKIYQIITFSIFFALITDEILPIKTRLKPMTIHFPDIRKEIIRKILYVILAKNELNPYYIYGTFCKIEVY